MPGTTFDDLISELGSPTLPTSGKGEKVVTDSLTGFPKKVGTIPQVCPTVKGGAPIDERLQAFVAFYTAWKELAKFYTSDDDGVARATLVYDEDTQKMLTETRKWFIAIGRERLMRVGANLQAEKAKADKK